MKYKVSLLPEKVRKRLNSKKKAEKIKSIALIIMLMLLAVLLVALGSKVFADKKLDKVLSLNTQYEQKVQALQQYRDINTNLQNKITLIDSIQVKEPSLYNFIASLSNIKQPGISVATIECADWKTARTCAVTGTCDTREEFNTYLEKIQKIKGVSSATCTAYDVTIEEGKHIVNFAINVSCLGGAAVAPTTDAAAAGTSDASTTAAAE